MKQTVSRILSLLVICGVAVAQTPATAGKDEAELRAVEERWDAASVKGDTAALGEILADSLITTTPEGKVRTKAQTLARIKSGEVKFETSKVDDLKIAVYGNAAVVNGRWRGKFVENGKSKDGVERFTDFFIRENGKWRCVASHASNIQ